MTNAKELPKLDLEQLVERIEWARNHPYREGASNTWFQDRWSMLTSDELIQFSSAYDEMFELWGDQNYQVKVGSEFDKEMQRISQGDACGSSHCIAGETVHENGYRMLYDIDLSAGYCVQQRPTDQLDAKGNTIWEDVPEALPISISDVAADLLGITKGESTFLFDGENSLHQLESVANLLADRRGLPVPYPENSFGLGEEKTEMWNSLHDDM